MTQFVRSDGRSSDQLRSLEAQLDIAPHAAGSLLIRFGSTQVICAASLEASIPRWMQREENPGGWMSAEYSMLPYSTLDRKQRDVQRGKQDGRSIEIQRLIGRSLRAVADLSRLPGHTLWLDCDVLQADGGTRTASITGAWIAAEIAVQRAIKAGKLERSPFTDSVAAISAGIVDSVPLLDLCYVEDRDASVDANIVMTGSSRCVEVQASGEEATYTRQEMEQLMDLAEEAIRDLTEFQLSTLQKAIA